MWLAVFSSVLSALACLLCVAAIRSAARNAYLLRELQGRVQDLPLSRLRSLETLCAEHSELLESLANRIKMQKVRNAANHVRENGAIPDPYRDPDGWRKAMNSKLQREKLGL